MTDNVDEAWNQFKKSSGAIAKASVNEKLDTLAAQLNEVQTDTKRLAQIVPKIMGDENAIDEANAGAMDPMAMMGGGMPPGGEEGGEPPMGGDEEMMPEGEEGMPPEDEIGAEGEEGLPPESAPETGGAEGEALNGEGEAAPTEDVGEDLFAEEGNDEDLEEFDTDISGEGDHDAVDVLKDALQEALDNDQMGLVSKIADAIAKLQGSSAGGENVLSGSEDLGLGGDDGSVSDIIGDEGIGGAPEPPAEEPAAEPESGPEPEPAPESDEKEDESVEKSAIAKTADGVASPEGTMEPIEASSTEEVKAKVMEAVAEGLDEALGTDEEIPTEEESEEEESEEEDEDYDEDEESEDESETIERNEEIAENPFEECDTNRTMKSALEFAEHTSFRDLLSFKKMNHCGVDGKPAKGLEMFMKMDNTQTQLDDLNPTPGMNNVAEESKESVEEIPLENVESAIEIAEAPPALEVGERTEVEEGTIDNSNQTAPEQMDEVGEPLNVSNEDSGLGPMTDEEGEILETREKSATLDEIGKPCQDLKSGESSKPADMLDDVDEEKHPSGSATSKPTIADDVGEKKGKGENVTPKSQLDDLDPHKGTGSAKKGGDMLDDVGHEKRSTEHTVKPGTGLLDDVDEVKKSEIAKTSYGGSPSDNNTQTWLSSKAAESNGGRPAGMIQREGAEYLGVRGPTKEIKGSGGKNLTGPSDNLIAPESEPEDQVSVNDLFGTKKSASDNGKHIMSMKELMSVRKSGQRPDAVTSTSGDLVRPELGTPIRKTASAAPVRMGHGVDPKKVTEQDWAEYKLYMAQKKL